MTEHVFDAIVCPLSFIEFVIHTRANYASSGILSTVKIDGSADDMFCLHKSSFVKGLDHFPTNQELSTTLKLMHEIEQRQRRVKQMP
jgi:hypothetical protein